MRHYYYFNTNDELKGMEVFYEFELDRSADIIKQLLNSVKSCYINTKIVSNKFPIHFHEGDSISAILNTEISNDSTMTKAWFCVSANEYKNKFINIFSYE